MIRHLVLRDRIDDEWWLGPGSRLMIALPAIGDDASAENADARDRLIRGLLDNLEHRGGPIAIVEVDTP